MKKYLFFAIFWAVLAIVSFYFREPIGTLFLIFSIRDFAICYGIQKSKEPVEAEDPIVYGKMGPSARYAEFDNYGLYIEINNKPVFIHIAEDEFVREREKWAVTLFENTETINQNFQKFIAGNPDLQGEEIHFIEFDSKNLAQGEITWNDNDDYTLSVNDILLKTTILTGFDFERIKPKPVPWWKPVW
ncbi:MAG: hypothetical protein LBP52_03140 [Burkholderiaceae bacterium]|jgi:hypothetical protein|nr:hypothetical protein [Burkholderiaceae bacterium]